jgi:hypothetical protein
MGMPDSWRIVELDGGGHALIGFADESMHALAPPGVRIRLDEPDEDRVLWRHAVWRGERRGAPPLLTVDAPEEVCDLQTREVVEMLPDAQHDFVRRAMALQLTRAYTYICSPASTCFEETRARIGGRTCMWVTEQLVEAFPSESWFRPRIESVDIPDTAEELLRELLPPASRDTRRRSLLISWVKKVGRTESMLRSWHEFHLDSSWALLELRCRLSVWAFLGRL